MLSVYAFSLSAQNKAVLDSLEQVASRATTDSARVVVIGNLAAQYTRYGMPQAEEKLKQILAITDTYQPSHWPSLKAYQFAKGKVCFLHGNFHKRRGNYPDAIQYYHQARETSELAGNFPWKEMPLLALELFIVVT